jgi:SulP family sulfate permease
MSLKGAFEGYTMEYVSKEVLLGITIGFAQIPESVAFAFLANLAPPIALHAAWMVGLICSLFGGRPGMVNGATGAFAAIISTFLPEPVKNGGNGEGVETIFPSVIFAGFLMCLIAQAGLSKFVLLLPAPVMIGFCNGLAIVIGLAQLHPFQDSDTHEWKEGLELMWMIIIMLGSMATMEFLPKIPLKCLKVIPSSMMAIIVAIALEFAVARNIGDFSGTDTIGDVSKFTLDTAYPCPFFIDSPGREYPLEKLGLQGKSLGWWIGEGPGYTIFVQGVLLCIVGTIESLMTAEVVEAFVKTPTDGKKTVAAMGIGNILSGFCGGMGGNAMIGLSTINVLNGGRGRLAPTTTALVVMAATCGAYEVLNYIPVAALSGIMIVVVLHTFKWHSLIICFNCLPKSIRSAAGSYGERKIPRVETAVIIIVTLLSIFTNIAYSVLAGTAICALMFSWTAASTLEVTTEFQKEANVKVYKIEGPVFFTTANKLLKLFDPDNDPEKVEVVFGYSSLMDFTAISTMHKVAMSYKAKDKAISFKSLNVSSQRIVEKANTLIPGLEWEAADPNGSAPKVSAVPPAENKKVEPVALLEAPEPVKEAPEPVKESGADKYGSPQVVGL